MAVVAMVKMVVTGGDRRRGRVEMAEGTDGREGRGINGVKDFKRFRKVYIHILLDSVSYSMHVPILVYFILFIYLFIYLFVCITAHVPFLSRGDPQLSVMSTPNVQM